MLGGLFGGGLVPDRICSKLSNDITTLEKNFATAAAAGSAVDEKVPDEIQKAQDHMHRQLNKMRWVLYGDPQRKDTVVSGTALYIPPLHVLVPGSGPGVQTNPPRGQIRSRCAGCTTALALHSFLGSKEVPEDRGALRAERQLQAPHHHVASPQL